MSKSAFEKKPTDHQWAEITNMILNDLQLAENFNQKKRDCDLEKEWHCLLSFADNP